MASNYDFVSIGYSAADSEMLNNAAAAVTAAEAWDWMRHFNEESFMFSQDPMIQRITDKMGDYAGHHSGASFGMTMRVMEHIAKHGWDSLASEVTKNNKRRREPEVEDPAVRQARKDAFTEKAFRALRQMADKTFHCTCTAAEDRFRDLQMADRRAELNLPTSPSLADLERRRAERAEQGEFLWCNCEHKKE
jgi:hypothetical protein